MLRERVRAILQDSVSPEEVVHFFYHQTVPRTAASSAVVLMSAEAHT